jgi:dTDP-4-amino-4,6-dideoxygalactose transaminase
VLILILAVAKQFYYMKDIRMVDLNSQYLKIKPEVDKAIQDVLNSSAFINGAPVKEFQHNLENYLKVKHAIPCGNGTDALQIAMMALGLEPGDEIITTSFTFIATVEVIALLKLKPILVDVNPKTFNIDIDELKKAITPKTKAIVPVHVFGQSADMDTIMNIAKEFDLKIIEDLAQAIGTDYTFNDGTTKKVGSIGDFGCTSFFPSKNLGAFGDGGALFTNDDKLAEIARSIVNHGMKVKYRHETIGINSRLDTIQAAILNIKLAKLDSYINSRQDAAKFYDNAFKSISNLTIPFRDNKSTHTFHQYTLITKNINREELQSFLKENNIPSMVYYPIPIHLQKAYEYLGYKKGDLPITEELCNSVISLPMHTELNEDQLLYIVNNVIKFVTK